VKVHYFLHPLYGKEGYVVERRQYGFEKFFVVRFFDSNTRHFLPAWMTDPESCKSCKIEDKPACSLTALQELRMLLDGLAL
jgi:hypothetical protein